jgi:hypothetical protein
MEATRESIWENWLYASSFTALRGGLLPTLPFVDGTWTHQLRGSLHGGWGSSRQFGNACYARGIITRDNEWELCFDEASHFQTGWYLRRLLISAMVYGGLADASSIWEKFGHVLCEGLTYTIRQKRLFCDRPNLDYGLFLIHKDLLNEEVEDEQGPSISLTFKTTGKLTKIQPADRT